MFTSHHLFLRWNAWAGTGPQLEHSKTINPLTRGFPRSSGSANANVNVKWHCTMQKCRNAECTHERSPVESGWHAKCIRWSAIRCPGLSPFPFCVPDFDLESSSGGKILLIMQLGWASEIRVVLLCGMVWCLYFCAQSLSNRKQVEPITTKAIHNLKSKQGKGCNGNCYFVFNTIQSVEKW